MYVAGFEKTCVVNASNFAHLEIHKNHNKWYTDLRDEKRMVVLQSLKISHHPAISNKFYMSPKLKNWICELYQIRSHNYVAVYVPTYHLKSTWFHECLKEKLWIYELCTFSQI